MHRVFIGLGSNIGSRLEVLQCALGAIEDLPYTAVIKTSSVYETEPVGVKEQPKFLNMVTEVETALGAEELFFQLRDIEQRLGRTQREHWGPREIDLDILYYGEEIIHTPTISVPHPEIANRRFVLIPMKEIAPGYRDPIRRLTIVELVRSCPDTSAVRKISRDQKRKRVEN